GWWDEWYDGNNGWAIPSADGVDDQDRRDDLEATALYDLIENEVAPRFYDLDAEGVPTRWIEMVRHTLTSLGPKVLAARMVRDYVRQLYAPAAHTARALNSDFHGARDLAKWKKNIRAAWPAVKVEHVESTGIGDAPEVGVTMQVRAFVALGDIDPAHVEVQVVHGKTTSEDVLTGTIATPMQVAETYEGGRYRFDADVTLERAGAFGYTVRVVPNNEALANVSELGLVAVPVDHSEV
ncbi:MAG: DUF3417 domain-containing protein, partial [Nocardioidaceae bacterium]|nr:DUF3417 domain-containing protein [Nocardioidaceae bacterium]